MRTIIFDNGGLPWTGRSRPRFRSDWEPLFRETVNQLLTVQLFRVYARSLASENGARLQAMAGAEENIESRIDDLTRDYNRVRQEAVTEELLDLTSGYEALRDPTNRITIDPPTDRS